MIIRIWISRYMVISCAWTSMFTFFYSVKMTQNMTAAVLLSRTKVEETAKLVVLSVVPPSILSSSNLKKVWGFTSPPVHLSTYIILHQLLSLYRLACKQIWISRTRSVSRRAWQSPTILIVSTSPVTSASQII